SSKLDESTIANEQHVGIQLLDVHLGDANLTGLDWPSVHTLYSEHQARARISKNGKPKSEERQDRDYREAMRSYRQLSVALQQQGLNEDAARFAYRAQVLQRQGLYIQMTHKKVALSQRARLLRAWLFSWFLYLLAGYGYRLGRSFLAYLLAISLFMILYHVLDPHLAWNEAFVVSMTAFHGRGFSPSTFTPGDPLSLISAAEAFVGLIIEVTFIATLTQRFFNR
ncbi:MAG TPA: pentapeptide repeat-containing protein, partial [Ktedonobacteraceae bacterium]